MRRLTCASLFTANGWIDRPVITIDDQGCILSIATRGDDDGGGAAQDLGGFVVPGFANAHSHAFQYAMAGLAEHLPKQNNDIHDDFWSWRHAMYGLAQRLSPSHMQAIAAAVYAEMLRHGITSVAEFHYLHHAPDGKAYPQANEMSARLLAAAQQAGIHLTLVPVMYAQGGFEQPAQAQQRRFLSASLKAYRDLVDDIAAMAGNAADFILGRGVHSLRAVAAADVKALFAEPFSGPLHLHIAEQRREVDECRKHLNKTPVAWLLDEVQVDERFNLVHATHMTDDETSRLAKSGATVVLCPSTEGNLGDGLFPLKRYTALGGRYTIGTDSHIGLSPLEELRWLDYSQRLRLEKRNILCEQPGDDSGDRLFREVWTSGQRALGLNTKMLSTGQAFDAFVVDAEHPAVFGKPAARRLAALIYAGDSSLIKRVLRRGNVLVENGRHVRGEAIFSSFRDQVSRI